ncbi:phytanoyl-CoA dioxygenase family protein [Francisella hispaniensis]|uniref:CmaB n=1 Tax=Francisella hispaniensis TaxID=622488 RepID=F4BHR7_9GAMM|nr:phytanoyl-CoA dioxygenase family protein [Francisella hispaniensis]AEE27011.1 CmaB [Francisella hispaniensis]
MIAAKTENLSQEDLHFFYENGYIGPFDGIIEDEKLDNIYKKILEHSRNKNDIHPVYGRYSNRDWYLVYPELLKFAYHPQVLNQLKAIMGENLILWRSNVFYKPPGTGPIGWHQEFGTFSGEDIGNNKPSLLPARENVNIKDLENSLLYSLDMSIPESRPSANNDFWDITLWVALNDISEDMGPLRILPGSHKKRYPIRMKRLVDSDFWQNPFVDIKNKTELVEACNNSNLVLDVDTSNFLEKINIDTYSFEELKKLILDQLESIKGSTTVIDDIDETQIVTFPMKKGSYIIFSEAVMHGSSANTSTKDRLAINFRITPSSTLVYPSRLHGDYVDGFNINLTNHKSILLSGKNMNPNNAISDVDIHKLNS